MGSSEVITVKNIHIKYRYIAILIGCLIKRLSYSLKNIILTSVNAVINTNMGSVGIDNPAPPVRSVRLTDTGVAITTNHMAQSILYKVTQTARSPTGMNKASHHSIATITAITGSIAMAIAIVTRLDIVPLKFKPRT